MRYQSGWRLEYAEIIVGADRQQVTLLLEFLDDFIDDDNTVRCNGSIVSGQQSRLDADRLTVLRE